MPQVIIFYHSWSKISKVPTKIMSCQIKGPGCVSNQLPGRQYSSISFKSSHQCSLPIGVELERFFELRRTPDMTCFHFTVDPIYSISVSKLLVILVLARLTNNIDSGSMEKCQPLWPENLRSRAFTRMLSSCPTFQHKK